MVPYAICHGQVENSDSLENFASLYAEQMRSGRQQQQQQRAAAAVDFCWERFENLKDDTVVVKTLNNDGLHLPLQATMRTPLPQEPTS